MPKFYFQLETTSHIRDVEGAVLGSLEEAKYRAVTLIAESLCERPNGFWEAEAYQITVTDDWGLTLFTVCMTSDIAPVVRPSAS